MGFLNVYNNFRNFNAHISHAFKVTFFDNNNIIGDNILSLSVKSVTKPVFKLNTETHNYNFGNSKFVIPIIDFSSATLSITFYEEDNMVIQQYLMGLYGDITNIAGDPINITVDELDNEMTNIMSSKTYKARLKELSIPGFNNEGPGSIQEITAEFNVLRVYNNEAEAKVNLDYTNKNTFKYQSFDGSKLDISIKNTAKPSEIKDNRELKAEKARVSALKQKKEQVKTAQKNLEKETKKLKKQYEAVKSKYENVLENYKKEKNLGGKLTNGAAVVDNDLLNRLSINKDGEIVKYVKDSDSFAELDDHDQAILDKYQEAGIFILESGDELDIFEFAKYNTIQSQLSTAEGINADYNEEIAKIDQQIADIENGTESSSDPAPATPPAEGDKPAKPVPEGKTTESQSAKNKNLTTGSIPSTHKADTFATVPKNTTYGKVAQAYYKSGNSKRDAMYKTKTSWYNMTYNRDLNYSVGEQKAILKEQYGLTDEAFKDQASLARAMHKVQQDLSKNNKLERIWDTNSLCGAGSAWLTMMTTMNDDFRFSLDEYDTGNMSSHVKRNDVTSSYLDSAKTFGGTKLNGSIQFNSDAEAEAFLATLPENYSIKIEHQARDDQGRYVYTRFNKTKGKYEGGVDGGCHEVIALGNGEYSSDWYQESQKKGGAGAVPASYTKFKDGAVREGYTIDGQKTTATKKILLIQVFQPPTGIEYYKPPKKKK